MTTAAAALLLLFAPALQGGAPKPEPKKESKKPEDPITALVGADVYTVTRGVIRNGTVLIKGKMIHKVGADVEVPDEATTVHLQGFRLYPGWVAASGSGFGGFARGGKSADSLDPFHLSMKLGTACGITTVFQGSGRSSAVIRLTVGEVADLVWFEPAATDLTGQWLRANSSRRHALREKFRKAKNYLARQKDYDRRKAAKKLEKDEKPPAKPGGVDAQLKLLKGETRARMSASRWSEIRTALNLVDEFPFKLTLMGVEEGWIHPEEISRAGVTCIINPRSQRQPDKNTNHPSGSTIELAGILHRAGVKIAVIPPSTRISTGGIGGRDLMTLPLSVGFAIRGGLPEQAALESITITAAEIIGIEDKVGSIEVGKAADLIVLDGDPFHYKTLVQKTYVAGREVYDKNTSPFFKHIRPKEIKVSAPKKAKPADKDGKPSPPKEKKKPR